MRQKYFWLLLGFVVGALSGCAWPGIDNRDRSPRPWKVPSDLPAGVNASAPVPTSVGANGPAGPGTGAAATLPSEAKTLLLLWDHPPGPFIYRVYVLTNVNQLLSTAQVLTNTMELSIRFPFEKDFEFFTVTAVDTNTGLESLPATK